MIKKGKKLADILILTFLEGLMKKWRSQIVTGRVVFGEIHLLILLIDKTSKKLCFILFSDHLYLKSMINSFDMFLVLTILHHKSTNVSNRIVSKTIFYLKSFSTVIIASDILEDIDNLILK